MITNTSQDACRAFSDDAAGGIMDGQRSSSPGTEREVLGSTALSQRSVSGRSGPAGYTTRWDLSIYTKQSLVKLNCFKYVFTNRGVVDEVLFKSELLTKNLIGKEQMFPEVWDTEKSESLEDLNPWPLTSMGAN